MAKKEGKELTPMMKQFFDFKAKYPEALLLFRCGDFYETYCEDAIVASRILGITLTHRNNGAGAKGDEMAGFPHHALDTYLPKLIRAGKRVAICDQLEDPKLTKKLVKRGITELVTPGVAMSDTVLNYKENNFLASVHFGKAACGVSFLDISTGEFLVGEGTYDYVEKLIGNFQPKEVLYDRGRKHDFERYFGNRLCTFELDDWVFTEQTAHQKLYKHFNVKSLKGFGVDHMKNGVIAAGAILQYLEQTLHTQIAHITSISRIEEDKYFAKCDRSHSDTYGRSNAQTLAGVPLEGRETHQRAPGHRGVLLSRTRVPSVCRRTTASYRRLGAHHLESSCGQSVTS